VPEDVAQNKRYAGCGGFTIAETAEKVAADSNSNPNPNPNPNPNSNSNSNFEKVAADFGKIDILVHSLANGPEVSSLVDLADGITPEITPGAAYGR